MSSPARLRYLFAAFLLLSCLGLGPQQLALIVNSNVPESLQLARQYAAARGVPDGRIIVMDLPAGEEMQFDQYERYVVPFVRGWLRVHHLNDQVKCLVTFYGVPFRIRDRTDTPAEKLELDDLDRQRGVITQQCKPLVAQLEDLARTLDPSYRPPPIVGSDSAVQGLVRRYNTALRVAGTRLGAATQPSTRAQLMPKFLDLMARLGGQVDLVDHANPKDMNPGADVTKFWTDQRREVVQALQDVQVYEQLRYDPEARAAVRKVTADHFGLLRIGGILDSQIDYLTPGNTNSAFDSELALLWVNYYPRNGMIINPLYYNTASPWRAQALLVSRLDAPDAKTVAQMIQTSVAVEQKGLHGVLAVNSYGFPNKTGPDGRNMYKLFDLKFRDLADLVQKHGNIPVVAEYKGLFRAKEVDDTAVYAGWYSVRRYVDGMKFVPGAVGYHVASLEMVSLREPLEHGWVHGLLNDGVVATLGPVAEPYMDAFPPPDEFFPLLFTGKLTLAEVYWKTELTASWQMCLIGDPLYNPFKVDPVLKPQDLPLPLRRLIPPAPPATNSSSRP